MPHPLLVVMISAGSAAPAGWADSADTTPDTSSGEATVECVLPESALADTTEPVETTVGIEATAPADTSPNLGFFDGFCTHAQHVAAVAPLLTGPLTIDGSEQFRVGMCDPSFRPPDREQATLNWVTYIEGTAHSDAESAETWLDAGVLTEFDETDADATAIDEDVLAELVDIDLAFLDEFEANRDEWCADLLESVDTTEA